jgi:hypothetical protein
MRHRLRRGHPLPKKPKTAPPRCAWLSRAEDEEVGGYCLLLWRRSSSLCRRSSGRRRRRRGGGGGGGAAAAEETLRERSEHGVDGGASEVLVRYVE